MEMAEERISKFGDRGIENFQAEQNKKFRKK